MMQNNAQATKLVNLYTESSHVGRPQMFGDALTATIRWAGPETTEAELREFVQRQIALLGGTDMLSTMVRDGWEALAEELAIPARPATVVSLADHAETRHAMAGAPHRANVAPQGRRFARERRRSTVAA